MAKGLVIAAPRSGSGKTVVTLAIAAALRKRRISVAPAKVGPDYIDPTLLARAAGHPAINLDPWAMRPARLHNLAWRHSLESDVLLIEGVMGLFDGAGDGFGSTGDLASLLDLPVFLVVDCEGQSHTIAPIITGLATWKRGVRIAGIILNRVASPRHEVMLREAVARTGIECIGAIPRMPDLGLPERHLGLVLPNEIDAFDAFVDRASLIVGAHLDIDRMVTVAGTVDEMPVPSSLMPLGNRVAIARDDAFAFLYEHHLADWRRLAVELSFFSPLADEPPNPSADAVFLPGGYPELHAGRLAAATRFSAGLRAARDRGALIYGECGGFMVLGDTLTDKSGTTHRMTGLLPVTTRIDQPRRHLGYRKLTHASPLPWPQTLKGHEFHYSTGTVSGGTPLFMATDARDEPQEPMGCVVGRVMGSYAHVIDG